MGTAITPQNVLARCNQAACHRWSIEENNLVEKHQGYSYQHAFSYNWNALKGWHALLHIAHLINILALFSVGLFDTVKRWGIQATVEFLWQTFSGNWLDLPRLRELRNKPAQLRLVF